MPRIPTAPTHAYGLCHAVLFVGTVEAWCVYRGCVYLTVVIMFLLFLSLLSRIYMPETARPQLTRPPVSSRNRFIPSIAKLPFEGIEGAISDLCFSLEGRQHRRSPPAA